MEDFIAIDFETANNNPTSICSIGIVIYLNGKFQKEIYRLVNPRMEFDPFCVSIHKIDSKDVIDQPDFHRVWQEINPLLPLGIPFVAHNALFDQNCLQLTCDRYHLSYPKAPFFCTFHQAKRLLPLLPNHKLNTVAAACGFHLENHHNALADAKACAAIAQKIL